MRDTRPFLAVEGSAMMGLPPFERAAPRTKSSSGPGPVGGPGPEAMAPARRPPRSTATAELPASRDAPRGVPMIFMAAAGLIEHDHDNKSPERVDPGGRSGSGTGVLHGGARLRTAHRHRGVARGQAGGSSATRVERRPGATASGQRDPDGRAAGHNQR